MARLSRRIGGTSAFALALNITIWLSVCSSMLAAPSNSSGVEDDYTSRADYRQQEPTVIRTVPSSFLLNKFQSSSPAEVDVFQMNESAFTFAKDGFQFVRRDPDIKEVATEMEKWNQHPRTRQVKTKLAELQYHMAHHMRRFLRRVLPSNMKAYDVKFRALPNKSGDSPHQNEKPQLHQDFNRFPFRVWFPRQRLDGGLIVSPSKGPPFQLFGSSVDVGDAWVFHSDVFHGPEPSNEPEERGYVGTFSFCDNSEGLCFENEHGEEDEIIAQQPRLFLSA